MTKYYPFFIIFFINTLAFGQYTYQGEIIDSKSKTPLAFVNVSDLKTNIGTVSDINGKFKIVSNNEILNLNFSYLGYSNLTLNLENKNNKNLKVEMSPTSFQLEEVVVLPGENPAHRIIRNVIENKNKNNPKNLNSYYYEAYNKMYFSLEIPDSLKNLNEDEKLEKDTSTIKILNLVEKQHLFMIESVSDNFHQKGKPKKEFVKASKTSGLKNPNFAFLSEQMQSFSFYDEFVVVYDKKYLNPIANNGIKQYFFLLKDTILGNDNDTTFVISFKPRKGKIFDGLEGLLYINTDGFALKSVNAKPYESKDNTEVSIKQFYEKQEEGTWFPKQLITEIKLKNISTDIYPIVGFAKTEIEKIEINQEIESKIFRKADIIIEDDAYKLNDEDWEKLRLQELSEKERRTYHIIDSIGKAEKLDQKMKLLETLSTGKLPIGVLSIPLNSILRYNDYEGFRLGLGLETNQNFSKWFSVGGYFAYGFRDQKSKYGGNTTFTFHPKTETKLNLIYKNDVIETGGQSFFFDKQGFQNETESYRRVLINRMDNWEHYEVNFSTKAVRFWNLSVFGNHQIREVTNDYLFNFDDGINDFQNGIFNITEAGVDLRFAFREKIYQSPKYSVSLGTHYPEVFLRLSQGFDNLIDGQFNFRKIDAKIIQKFKKNKVGQTTMAIIGGKVDGTLPYTLLYNARATYSNIGIASFGVFETMRVNEFISDEYVGLFFRHNFGTFMKKGSFAPELLIAHNSGWGNINNTDLHEGINFEVMDKGFHESGILINKLLVSTFSGVGIGLYHRYGHYAFDEMNRNFAVKLTSTIVF